MFHPTSNLQMFDQALHLIAHRYLDSVLCLKTAAKVDRRGDHFAYVAKFNKALHVTCHF